MPKLFNLFSRAKQKDRPASKPVGIGTVLHARYRLEEEIGRGGMGVVYRAHDLQDDRGVAVKVINLEKANALTRQQFLLEAEIAARLDHPHIVRVYESGTVEEDALESSPYMVMELVQGKGLDELHELTYARIVDIAKQICEALEYAHRQGIVYRDLKPGNVLIEKCGFEYFVKLTDFGLARPRGMANAANESNVAGTLFYLAPELIAGQPADVASDLYALGATLYEMITGRVPFSDFDEETILSQHLKATVTPPSHSRDDIPQALETIVLRLLQKNPQDRFASAQEVWDALDQVPVKLGPESVRGNLPPLPADFIGHDNEIAQIKGLLASNPLVTIQDESLALAVGTQLNEIFRDGVWWVDFQSVENPSLVLEKVASVLGVQPDANRSLTVSLVAYLREKNILLILVRCEHLLGACTQLADTLVRMCPDVKVIMVNA